MLKFKVINCRYAYKRMYRIEYRDGRKGVTLHMRGKKLVKNERESEIRKGVYTRQQGKKNIFFSVSFSDGLTHEILCSFNE